MLNYRFDQMLLYEFLLFFFSFFFFFNDTATTEIYTLSLHDALRDLLGQGTVRVPREQLELVAHRASRSLPVQPLRVGWGGRDRTSVAGSKAPSPTAGRRPKVTICLRGPRHGPRTPPFSRLRAL